MTDQEQPQENAQDVPEAQQPAGAENTSSADDNRVPYTRFKSVIDENNSLKARLDALEKADNERKQAEMSELEKAQAKASDIETRFNELNAQLEQERKARLEDRRDSALAQSLASAGAIDADELVLILKAKQPDEVAALMTDDGTLDSDGIKALVDKTKAARAHAFQASGVGSPSNRGGAVPAPSDAQTEQYAQFLRDHGFKPNKDRLGRFIREGIQSNDEE